MKSWTYYKSDFYVFLPSKPGPSMLSVAVLRGHITLICVYPCPVLAQGWSTVAFLLLLSHSLIYSYLAESSFIHSEICYMAAKREVKTAWIQISYLRILLQETWPSIWKSWTGWSRKSGENLDLGNQKRSREGTALSGWPTYATLKGESSCAQISLLTFLKPYNSAVPDTTILQKTNSIEGQRGLKTTYARCYVTKPYSLPRCISQWSPCSLSFHTIKMKLTL